MKDSGFLAREREDYSIPKGKHEVKDSCVEVNAYD